MCFTESEIIGNVVMQVGNYVVKSVFNVIDRGGKISWHECCHRDEIAALENWFLLLLAARSVVLSCRSVHKMKNRRERNGQLCSAASQSVSFFCVVSLMPIEAH